MAGASMTKVVTVGALMMAMLFAIAANSSVHAQSMAPAPAPTSDGSSIDQGVAYMLMFMALLLTYLIHPLDASLF